MLIHTLVVLFLQTWDQGLCSHCILNPFQKCVTNNCQGRCKAATRLTLLRKCYFLWAYLTMEGLHNALSRMRSGVFEHRKKGWWSRKGSVAAIMPSVAARTALAGQCFSSYIGNLHNYFPTFDGRSPLERPEDEKGTNAGWGLPPGSSKPLVTCDFFFPQWHKSYFHFLIDPQRTWAPGKKPWS